MSCQEPLSLFLWVLKPKRSVSLAHGLWVHSPLALHVFAWLTVSFDDNVLCVMIQTTHGEKAMYLGKWIFIRSNLSLLTFNAPRMSYLSRYTQGWRVKYELLSPYQWICFQWSLPEKFLNSDTRITMVNKVDTLVRSSCALSSLKPVVSLRAGGWARGVRSRALSITEKGNKQEKPSTAHANVQRK